MGNRLKQFVEQIEGLDREISHLSLDRSELYKSAKQQGLNPKVIRRLIRERRRSPAELAEEERLHDLYRDQLETPVPSLPEREAAGG